MIQQAMQGDTQAQKLIIEVVDGKAAQSVNMNLGGSIVDVDYSTLSDKQKAAICAANRALREAEE